MVWDLLWVTQQLSYWISLLILSKTFIQYKNSLMPEAYPGPIQSNSYLRSFSQKSNLILSSTPMTCKRATNTTLSGMIHSEVNFYWPILSGNGKTTYFIKWFILNASYFSTKLHGHMGWTSISPLNYPEISS
jgi:hypothetical protein